MRTYRHVGSMQRLIVLAAAAALLGYAWRHRSRTPKRALAGDRGVHVRESITVNASPEELYSFWRSYDNLPQLMPHLDRVEEVDYKLSRWTAKGLGGMPITWMAETINEVPFETIGWKTLPGESLQHAGSVVFKRLPETGATDVRVHFQYSPPGGKAAAWFAAFMGQDPAKLTRDGLTALQQRFAGRPRA